LPENSVLHPYFAQIVAIILEKCEESPVVYNEDVKAAYVNGIIETQPIASIHYPKANATLFNTKSDDVLDKSKPEFTYAVARKQCKKFDKTMDVISFVEIKKLVITEEKEAKLFLYNKLCLGIQPKRTIIISGLN
jgi:hypothetical protein